jgi:deoxyhypusine synthase
MQGESEKKKKRDIEYREREKRISESVAKEHRYEMLERFIKKSTTENKEYKYDEIALKKFIKKLGREFVESALNYKEEFVKAGFTVEYKYDSDKKCYSVNKKYH